jgi:glutathione S-transferase
VTDRLVANAEELILHAMSADVALVTSSVAGAAAPPKLRPSLENALAYLDAHVERMVAALPAGRAVSFCETALYCAVTHLPFRKLLDLAPYPRLVDFCARFGARESARATEYRFDAA